MKLHACASLILTAAFLLCACSQTSTEQTQTAEEAQQQPAAGAPEAVGDPTPGQIVAGGTFMGRSGKPMAGARLVLGTVSGDEMFPHSNITLAAAALTAVADEQGRFQFTDFTPGPYTIVYQLKGDSDLIIASLNIKTLSATDKSIAPLLKNFELGKDEPYEPRAWGKQFTLMDGHTLFSHGNTMRIWNATARDGKQGPYVEIRRNKLWLEELDDNSEINLEAWSF